MEQAGGIFKPFQAIGKLETGAFQQENRKHTGKQDGKGRIGAPGMAAVQELIRPRHKGVGVWESAL